MRRAAVEVPCGVQLPQVGFLKILWRDFGCVFLGGCTDGLRSSAWLPGDAALLRARRAAEERPIASPNAEWSACHIVSCYEKQVD